MRRLIFATVIIACAVPLAFAQGKSSDYDKLNVFLGASHNRVDTDLDDLDPAFDGREGFNGFNASVTGNVTRYIGLKGDYSFHTKSFNETFAPASFNVDANLHQFFGGVQIKDNAKDKRFKPFAHFMAGVARAKIEVSATGVPGFTSDSVTETGFAGIVGGGIDVRLNDRLDVRIIQIDYNPTRLGEGTQHNFRVGVGIVIK